MHDINALIFALENINMQNVFELDLEDGNAINKEHNTSPKTMFQVSPNAVRNQSLQTICNIYRKLTTAMEQTASSPNSLPSCRFFSNKKPSAEKSVGDLLKKLELELVKRKIRLEISEKKDYAFNEVFSAWEVYEDSCRKLDVTSSASLAQSSVPVFTK